MPLTTFVSSVTGDEVLTPSGEMFQLCSTGRRGAQNIYDPPMMALEPCAEKLQPHVNGDEGGSKLSEATDDKNFAGNSQVFCYNRRHFLSRSAHRAPSLCFVLQRV